MHYQGGSLTLELDWALKYGELLILANQMLAATICGAMVGLEREFRKKDAGLKTFILICTGAALYTIMSLKLGSTDPARIAAQIVSGVGFIGGGVIFKSEDKVQGITTAAFIWVVAALGILVGVRYELEAIVLSVGMVISMSVISLFEKLIRGRVE